MIGIPKDKYVVRFLAGLFGLSFPLVEIYYEITQPSEEINLAIPDPGISSIVPFILGTIITAPFYWLFIRWSLQSYQENYPALGMNSERPLWSMVWTVIFGTFFLVFILEAMEYLINGRSLDTLVVLLGAYLQICLRYSVVNNNGLRFGKIIHDPNRA